MPKALTWSYYGRQYTTTQLRQLANRKYHLNITQRSLMKRLKAGWSVKKAISQPIDHHLGLLPTKYFINGQAYHEDYVINYATQHPQQIDWLDAIIAINLKYVILKSPLTRTAIAQKIHASNHRLDSYLRQEREPKIRTLVLLTHILNCKIDDIIKPHRIELNNQNH